MENQQNFSQKALSENSITITEAHINWWENLDDIWKRIFVLNFIHQDKLSEMYDYNNLALKYRNISDPIDEISSEKINLIISGETITTFLARLFKLSSLEFVDIVEIYTSHIKNDPELHEATIDYSFDYRDDLELYKEYCKIFEEQLSDKKSPLLILPDFRYFKKLTTIRLAYCHIQSLTYLEGLSQLKHLNLEYCVIDNQGFNLTNLTNLNELNVSHSNISLLSSDVPLESLRKVDLAYSKVEHISFLRNTINLSELILNIDAAQDLKSLYGSRSLEKLFIDIKNEHYKSEYKQSVFKDKHEDSFADYIVKLDEELKSLNRQLPHCEIYCHIYESMPEIISNSNDDYPDVKEHNYGIILTTDWRWILDILEIDGFIEDPYVYKKISLYGSGRWFKYNHYLSAFEGLTELSLTNFEGLDIKVLSEFEELMKVDLSYSKIDDLSPLEHAYIGNLDLSHCNIKDLSPLKKSGISDLYLAGIKINRFDFLSQSNITTVYLDEEKISDEVIDADNVEDLKDLPDIYDIKSGEYMDGDSIQSKFYQPTFDE
ncbi:hypothetical protein [Lonepinella sp. BR2271]|uniref:hypothetical protein n=1 Tax=Lonepinella sp. BR2271 TaxID=3434550 RepID=UPI003F6DA8E5